MHEKIASAVVPSVKEDRLTADKSQAKAASIADVSIGTWRTYELDRNAVTPKARAKCDRAAAQLAKMAKARREHFAADTEAA